MRKKDPKPLSQTKRPYTTTYQGVVMKKPNIFMNYSQIRAVYKNNMDKTSGERRFYKLDNSKDRMS